MSVMKHFHFPVFILWLSAALVSCRLDKPEPLPQEPTYSVRLNVDCERTIQEADEPLTMVKGAPYDLYAVQVYKKGVTGNYGKYAYGIFDNENDMVLDLPAGSTYKIEMTMVPNGVSVIAKGENGGYREPFMTGGFDAGPGKVTRAFTQSFSSYINKMNSGYAMLIGEGAEPAGYNRPPVSRFYGVVDNFTPTENSSLTIALKWVCFALTIVPEEFTEGSIEIEMEGAPMLTLTPGNPGAITKKIFTFAHSLSSEDWTDDNYSETVPISITWVKGDGTKVVLRDRSNPTVIKRRYNKIFTLPCGDAAPKGNITITKEDEILIDEVETVARP
ncbi:hypothetical protein [uncultured Rikenella sp.]|uniref:hypothetical protein n=1 Tax=uncultured Rikenella sp. TaxID=368003 RepID=UPI0026384031|nr:hypothetical protein [uncultured Rikenella sp.]